LRPPPILLNFLWTFGAQGQVAKGRVLDQHPMSYSGGLIDWYRQLGWDIAVVNVGAAVNASKLQKNVWALFDDMHHPSCHGVKFIADIILHAFYTNMAANCTASSFPKKWKPHNLTKSIVPPHKTLMFESTDISWKVLWTDLFQETTKIASLSAWVPRTSGVSRLAISREELNIFENKMSKMLFGKAADGRADRKFSFYIPKCLTSEPLIFTISEPNLKWIGFGGKVENTNMTINSKIVRLPARNCGWLKAKVWICYWMNLEDLGVANADQYNISMCHESTSEKDSAFFWHIVTMAVPGGSKRQQVPSAKH